MRLVGLLENFESAEGTVQLADDVVLHAVNDEEREELWRQRGEQLLGLDPVTLGVVGTATHLLRVESRAERFGHDGNAVPLQTRSADALTALRLQRGGSVIARYQWFEALPPVADYSSAVRPWIPSGLLSGPWTGTRGQYVLDEIDVAQVPQVLAHLDALQPPERTLALALRRFDLTYARGPVEDRIIDVWIALEALFAPDQSSEIRYRASSRIGRFLGQTPEERVDIQRFLRLSYDVRSHLVHGGDPDRFAKRTQPKVDAAGGLNGVADRTEDTLRRSLRQWIAAPRAPTAVVADIDDQMMA